MMMCVSCLSSASPHFLQIISDLCICALQVCKHAFSFSPVYAENAPTRLPFQELIVGVGMKACHVFQFILRLAFVFHLVENAITVSTIFPTILFFGRSTCVGITILSFRVVLPCYCKTLRTLPLPLFQIAGHFCFVLSQTSITLTKFTERYVNIYNTK